jgi:hypothetical protein
MLEVHLETPAFKALIGGLRILGNLLDCRLVDFASEIVADKKSHRCPRVIGGKIIQAG